MWGFCCFYVLISRSCVLITSFNSYSLTYMSWDDISLCVAGQQIPEKKKKLLYKLYLSFGSTSIALLGTIFWVYIYCTRGDKFFLVYIDCSRGDQCFGLHGPHSWGSIFGSTPNALADFNFRSTCTAFVEINFSTAFVICPAPCPRPANKDLHT